jgi:Cu2+-exporting ATPase
MSPRLLLESSMSELCQHCQEPIPKGLRIQSAHDPQALFCCLGCQSVYELICSQGLQSLYQQTSPWHQGKLKAPPSLQNLSREMTARLQTSARRALDSACDLPIHADYAPWHSVNAGSSASLYYRSVNASLPSEGSLGEIHDEVEAIIDIGGMTCAACGWINEHYLHSLGGVVQAQVSMATHRLVVRYRPRLISLGQLLTAIKLLGYSPHPINVAMLEEDTSHLTRQQLRESRALLWKLFIAGLATMQAMSFALPLYFANGFLAGAYFVDIRDEEAAILRWTTMMIATPALLYAGWDYFARSLRDLRFWRISMDLPIALGLLLGVMHSVWITIQGNGDIYFDSMTMLLFFLLSGRYAETRAHHRITTALLGEKEHRPAHVQRLTAGTWEKVPTTQLQVNDELLIRHGERIPCDGLLADHLDNLDRPSLMLDESMLTGESAAVIKHRQSAIHAGTINVGESFVLRVVNTGRGRLRQDIEWMVAKALAQKPRFIGLALTIARWFSLALLVVVALTCFYWVQTEGWDTAIKIIVALLVVTCPCALALSAPLTLSSTMANLLRHGILLQNVAVLEKIHRLSQVVVDKTGTLTEGALRISHHYCLFDDPALARARASLMEAQSEHPLAAAFRIDPTIASSNPPPMIVGKVQRHPHRGLLAMFNNEMNETKRWHIGTADFCEITAEEETQLWQQHYGRELISGDSSVWRSGQTAIYLACMERQSQRAVSLFVLQDQLRPQVKQIIQRWQRQGMQVSLLSGDRRESVQALGEFLNIPEDQRLFAQSPEDKADYVQQQQVNNRVLMMVGDGVNDAPVLALADISVGMPNASDLSKLSADLVLLPAVNVWEKIAIIAPILRRARKVLLQNYAWSALYNGLMIPGGDGRAGEPLGGRARYDPIITLCRRQ